MRGVTAAARLYSQLWENVPCRAQTAVPMLSPALSVNEINTWFADGISASEPTVHGTPYQTSALGRPRRPSVVGLKSASSTAAACARSLPRELIDLMQYWLERRLPQGVIKAGSAPKRAAG